MGVSFPQSSLASANIFQREIQFAFRLKCKIEFYLSPKNTELQANLVKSFAFFKILEKQLLVPSQAPRACVPCPCLSSTVHPLWSRTQLGSAPSEADAPVRVVDSWCKVTWCINLGRRNQGLGHIYSLFIQAPAWI